MSEVCELHGYIVAVKAGCAMRILWALLTTVAMAAGLAVASGFPVAATPMNCPPYCDRIPDSAWVDAAALPLGAVYRWPAPATVATAVSAPRFRFEDECATAARGGDPREYAVAARSSVTHPAGHWQLQLQVLHWRGETWRGGQDALDVVDAAAGALRNCQSVAPAVSPSLTTDEPDQWAAVISVDGRRVLRQYLVAHPRSSSVVELAMWAATPALVAWPAIPDQQVFDAMRAPLCTAYIDSCR